MRVRIAHIIIRHTDLTFVTQGNTAIYVRERERETSLTHIYFCNIDNTGIHVHVILSCNVMELNVH